MGLKSILGRQIPNQARRPVSAVDESGRKLKEEGFSAGHAAPLAWKPTSRTRTNEN